MANPRNQVKGNVGSRVSLSKAPSNFSTSPAPQKYSLPSCSVTTCSAPVDTSSLTYTLGVLNEMVNHQLACLTELNAKLLPVSSPDYPLNCCGDLKCAESSETSEMVYFVRDISRRLSQNIDRINNISARLKLQ